MMSARRSVAGGRAREQSWASFLRRWFLSSAWWLVAAVPTCTLMLMVWDGKKARERTFEQHVESLHRGENPEACIVHLQRLMLEALRAQRARAEQDGGRVALADRTSREHIAREALR